MGVKHFGLAFIYVLDMSDLKVPEFHRVYISLMKLTTDQGLRSTGDTMATAVCPLSCAAVLWCLVCHKQSVRP